MRGYFRSFATSFGELALYARLASGCAEDPSIAGMLLSARPGQERPVLLFAAVHDLVLRNPDLPLAGWYRSVNSAEASATGDPWPTFRSTCLEHRDELVEVIASRSTQTNEVNRSTSLAVLLAAACADLGDAPVTLVELGASAGLLLGVDRYRVRVGDHVVGDPDSPVRLDAEVRGPAPVDLVTFPRVVADRVGIDRDPIALADTDRVRWLEACLWPDEPWRIERFRAAVALLRSDPPPVLAGDMIDDFGRVVDTCRSDTHLVVFDSWALTYVARERRPALVEAIAAAAGDGRPVSWITAEAPHCVPGIPVPPWSGSEATTPDTVLGLRRWRRGAELEPVTVGWAHPHGNWIRRDV
ncbi:MAG: DUF2332 domain-containing protein [Actinobacteria bacterium]|nr:DUF2332 domain-containing protein [Actinomycetota bacterium]